MVNEYPAQISRIEGRVIFIALLQQAHGFVFVAESDVDARDHVRCNVFRRRKFFELIEDSTRSPFSVSQQHLFLRCLRLHKQTGFC